MRIIFLIVSIIVGVLLFVTTLQAEAPTAVLPEVTGTELVNFYFDTDEKVMLAIAQCESEQLQFKDGTVVTSYTNDFGYFQINQKSWDKIAKQKDLDYKGSLHDNVLLAKYIYDTQGLRAWTTYKNGCYKKYL